MGQTVLGNAIAFGFVDPAQLVPVLASQPGHPGPRWHPVGGCACTNASAAALATISVPAADVQANLMGPGTDSCPQLRRMLPAEVPDVDAGALHYITDTTGLAAAARNGLHVELATLGLWVWGPGAATADPRRSPHLTTDANLIRECAQVRDDLLAVVLSEPSHAAKVRILSTYLPAWSVTVKLLASAAAGGMQRRLVREVMDRAPHLIELAHAWADDPETNTAGTPPPAERVHEAWAVHTATTAWRAPVGHAVRAVGIAGYDLPTGVTLAPLLSNLNTTGSSEEVLCFDDGYTSAEVARAVEVTGPGDGPFGRQDAIAGFIPAFRASQL